MVGEENRITSEQVTPGMLAQARGCVSWNECWDDCVDAARWALEEIA